jgi:hypothetical protein
VNLDHPFWRTNPLNENESELVRLLYVAHRASTNRDNPSRNAVAMCGVASGDIGKAIASAILMFGNLHGPTPQTCRLLRLANAPEVAGDIIKYGFSKVPGWGCSFNDEAADETWHAVSHHIRKHWREMAEHIDEITKWIRAAGKAILPNPACYTAATALILGMPDECAPFLIISARLDLWAGLFLQSFKRQPPSWDSPPQL